MRCAISSAGLEREEEGRHFSADDSRLALAALLVHAVAIDGAVSDAERAKLRELLARNFGLSGDDLDRLIEDARGRRERGGRSLPLHQRAEAPA